MSAPEQKIAGMRQQLRNLEEVLTGMVKEWRAEADANMDEVELERFRQRDQTSMVIRRQAKADALRAAADRLEHYVDTWKQP